MPPNPLYPQELFPPCPINQPLLMKLDHASPMHSPPASLEVYVAENECVPSKGILGSHKTEFAKFDKAENL